MTHTRSVFSLWLSIVIVFLPSLALELLRPFNSAYTFLFSLIVGGALYGLFRLLCRLYPAGRSLLDEAEALVGRWFAVTAAVLFFLLGAFLCALFIEDFGTRIVHSLMLHSDARFYNVILIVAAAVFARSGLKTLGRMAEILVPVFSGIFLLLAVPALLLTPELDLSNPPSAALWQLLPGGAALSVLLGAGMLLFVCDREIAVTAHAKKQCAYTAVIAALYALLFPLLTDKLLGRFLAETTDSSFFLGLRQFKLFDRFGNTHILVMIPWMMLALLVCAAFFWALSRFLERILPRLSPALRQVLGPLFVLVIVGIRNEYDPYLSQSLWVGVIPLGLLLFYGFPLLLGVIRRRSKPRS